MLLKDNIESKEMPTTAGSMALITNDTGRDAPIVEKLKAAGAIILGKTNLSEWQTFALNPLSAAGVPSWRAYPKTPYAIKKCLWLVIGLGSGHVAAPRVTCRGYRKPMALLFVRHPLTG